MAKARSLSLHVCPNKRIAAWRSFGHHGEGCVFYGKNNGPLASDSDYDPSSSANRYLVREIYGANGKSLNRQRLKLWRELHKIPFAAVLQDAIQPGLVKQTVSLRGGGHNQHGHGGDRNPHAHNIATGAA